MKISLENGLFHQRNPEIVVLNFCGPRTTFSKNIRWNTLLCWHLI